MATGQGSLIFDFGSAPGSNMAVTTGVTATGMTSSSKIELYIDGTDSTATHNAYEHRLIELFGLALHCTAKTTDSFDAQAITQLRLTGTISARFVWAD